MIPATPPVTAPGRKGHQLPTRVGDELWAALEAVAKRERRYVSQLVTILLEEALTARGDWPPAAPDA